MDLDEARAANLANWEDRVVAHTGPGGYDLAAFAADPNHLDTIVRFDQPALGDLTDRELVRFEEHRSAPWNPLGPAMVPTGPFGEFELADRPDRLAATYTLQARKPPGP